MIAPRELGELHPQIFELMVDEFEAYELVLSLCSVNPFQSQNFRRFGNDLSHLYWP